MTVAALPRGVLVVSFFAFATFVPFSIAGMNIAFGFGALAWLASWASRDSARVPLHEDRLAWASLLLVASALPSVWMSENSARAIKDVSSYWQLLIVFWVGCNVLAVRMRAASFWTLVVSSTLACCMVLVQGSSGLDLGFLDIPKRYRPGGTLYTMTFAGIVYQLIVLNCAVLFTHAMRARNRIVLAAVVAIQIAAIMFTMTRGAWLALAAGLFALCVLLRNRVLSWIATVLVVALAVFAVSAHKGRSIPELLRSGLDIDASTRVVLWDIAWDLFKQHPLTGVGMGDYTIEADKLLAGRRVTTTVDTHNVYLHILATRGVIGFVPFVLFWTVLVRRLLRIRGSTEKGTADHQYAVGALAATVAVLVGALTELNIDDSEVFMAFMFVAGLALSPSFAAGSRYDGGAAQRRKNDSQRS
ncbi:MAG TPA: O-antigen ligase family protein [Candidatus Krumholzibacteria bacterium]|nr:O-antigen ligase family protein [Candidatus Krumholzibacteria bacterium]